MSVHLNTMTKECHYKDYDFSYHLRRRINRNTPDWLDRKLEEHIPVFVYGTLKSGFRNHGLLADTVSLGEAHSFTNNYVMESTPHDFPVVFQPKQVSTICHKVIGEVYLIPPKTLLELDRLEQNNEVYKRETHFFFLKDQVVPAKKTLRPSLKCWIYLGNPDFWETEETTPMKSKEIENYTRVYEWTKSDRPFLHNPESFFDREELWGPY